MHLDIDRGRGPEPLGHPPGGAGPEDGGRGGVGPGGSLDPLDSTFDEDCQGVPSGAPELTLIEDVSMASTSPLLRPVGRLTAGLFVAATVLLVGLNLNLFATPPNLPDSMDFVERILGTLDYRVAIWPFDFASAILFGVALALLVPFGRILGASAGAGDDRRSILFVWGLGSAGIVGVIAQLIYVGARQVTVDIAYCDCGYKEVEVIGQLWAMNLIEGAQDWLINGVAILLAIGVAVAGAVLGSGRMSSTWRWLSYAIAVLLVTSVVLSVVGVDDTIGTLLTAVAAGILLPAWIVGVGERLGGSASTEQEVTG